MANEVDQFIPLADVRREAEKCRIMLDKGVGDTDPLYAAYNALLMVLGYGVKPPSEMWSATPSPATGERACTHENSHPIGQQGQALCDDCGRIMPDETPELWDSQSHNPTDDQAAVLWVAQALREIDLSGVKDGVPTVRAHYQRALNIAAAFIERHIGRTE